MVMRQPTLKVREFSTNSVMSYDSVVGIPVEHIIGLKTETTVGSTLMTASPDLVHSSPSLPQPPAATPRFTTMASKEELWQEYEMLTNDIVDGQHLRSMVQAQMAKEKLLEWSIRDCRWDIVSCLLEMGIYSEEDKRKAFKKVAGASCAQLNTTSFFAAYRNDATTWSSPCIHGRREAVGIAIGLAAMAAHFDDEASKLLEEENIELPAWILAESIRLDGPGGKRLLEKCLCNREHRAFMATPSGKQFPHDQMAFLAQRPRTVVQSPASGGSSYLNNANRAVDILLPRKLDMVAIAEKWQTVKTRAAVRVFIVRDVCNSDVIKALAESPTNDPLSTDAAHAILEQGWLGAVMPYTLDCALNAVYVASLCLVTARVRHAETPGWACFLVCAMITVKDVVEEILQLLHTISPSRNRKVMRAFCNYICTLEQVSDWAGIMIDVFGMSVLWSGGVVGGWRCTLAVWAGVRWLRALYGLRGYGGIGPKLLPILSALQDTFIFMMVVCFFLAAAVHAYYALAVRDTSTPLYAAVLLMLRLGLFGDFDVLELEGVDTSYVAGKSEWEPRDPDPTEMFVPVHALFYIVGMCITLTLMNLLIGILSSNYDRYEDQSIPIFLRARATILVRYAARPWARKPWRSPGQLPACRDGYLWVATRAEVNLDDVRSVRTVFREELRRAELRNAQKPRSAFLGS